jgi:hypothetical protein
MSNTDSAAMPRRIDAHIRKEIDGLSLDEIVLSGGSFSSGEVVGKTAAGVYTKLDLTAEATESNEAAGIVYGNFDASGDDADGLAHVRMTAVEGGDLIFPDAATPTQKAAFLEQLEVLHIVVR